MWGRIKGAWLILTGRAYAIPYASIYENVMVRMEESGVTNFIKMSEAYDRSSRTHSKSPMVVAPGGDKAV